MQIDSSPRLIVTGRGLGGPIASLFTLSLLGNKNSSEKKKPPLCITFGSPLVGNKKFQEAISRSSTWSSCFLHVVSIKDPFLKRLNPDIKDYMPFGTFLFCSDISSTCFENPKSVFEYFLYHSSLAISIFITFNFLDGSNLFPFWKITSFSSFSNFVTKAFISMFRCCCWPNQLQTRD